MIGFLRSLLQGLQCFAGGGIGFVGGFLGCGVVLLDGLDFGIVGGAAGGFGLGERGGFVFEGVDAQQEGAVAFIGGGQFELALGGQDFFGAAGEFQQAHFEPGALFGNAGEFIKNAGESVNEFLQFGAGFAASVVQVRQGAQEGSDALGIVEAALIARFLEGGQGGVPLALGEGVGGVQLVGQVAHGLALGFELIHQAGHGVAQFAECVVQADKGPDHLHGLDIGFLPGFRSQVQAFDVFSKVGAGFNRRIAMVARVPVPGIDGLKGGFFLLEGLFFLGKKVIVIGALQLHESAHADLGRGRGVSQAVGQVNKGHARGVGGGAGEGQGGVEDAEIDGHAAHGLGGGFAGFLHRLGVFNQFERVARGIFVSQAQAVARLLALEGLGHSDRRFRRQHAALDLIGHFFQGARQSADDAGHDDCHGVSGRGGVFDDVFEGELKSILRAHGIVHQAVFAPVFHARFG